MKGIFLKFISLAVIVSFLSVSLLFSQAIPQKTRFMHTGFIFDAVLETAIFSFNTISPVIAVVEHDITFLGKILLPRHTKLIGTCQVVQTLDRVNIRWNTVVFPDGSEMDISAIALHTDGSGGVPGRVKRETARMPARILLRSAAAGIGFVTRSDLATDITEGITDEAQQVIAQQVNYSIKIEKGTPIFIFVDSRIEF